MKLINLQLVEIKTNGRVELRDARELVAKIIRVEIERALTQHDKEIVGRLKKFEKEMVEGAGWERMHELLTEEIKLLEDKK